MTTAPTAAQRWRNEMAKYRKKPVTIEAFQIGIDYIADWFMDKVTTNDVILCSDLRGRICADIKTLEGTMRADFGDFVVRGIHGELYPCKPDIFDETYEEVE